MIAAQNTWCWELAQLGRGPDWFFSARIAPAGERALAQAAASARLHGFSSCPAERTYCQSHQQLCLMYALIDTSAAAAYLDNLAGEQQRNIWIYNLVRIHRDMIDVECGYGGRGPAYNAAETLFLLETLARPEIALQGWQVFAGGDGYNASFVHQGQGFAELVAYLTPPPVASS